MRVVVETPVARSARVQQLSGMFDLPPTDVSRVVWDVSLPLEEREWQIGLITGPSGSGKTTIARAFWPDLHASLPEWPTDRAVVDAFPEAMSIRDVTGLLSSVGFSSPPSWLRPHRVLSTGEQFRAEVALRLALAAESQRRELLIDEFTSVVDRRVAQIGSAAVAKTVRRLDLSLIAVTVHEDVIDWLQPDWLYVPATDTFTWRSVQPRPAIELTVERSPKDLWRLFAPHHYLSRKLPSATRLFVAYHGDDPVACYAVMRFVHRTVANAWQASRLVVLPDYQGVGIGLALSSIVAASARAVRARFFATTAHPARIAGLSRSRDWKMTMKPQFKNAELKGAGIRRHSGERMVASFEFVGPADLTPLSEHLRIHTLPALATA